MNRVLIVGIGLFLGMLRSGIGQEHNKKELLDQMMDLTPKDEAFVYAAPKNWGRNLLSLAQIVFISSGEKVTDVANIIDQKPWTTWTTKCYSPSPSVIFDLGKASRFNSLVVFNRHSDARGAGWGNNAVKVIEMQVAHSNRAESFSTIGTFDLLGPRGTCVQNDTGRMCFFIDSTSPNVIRFNETEARFVRLILKSAFWEEEMPDKFRTSMALSELMLFYDPRVD